MIRKLVGILLATFTLLAASAGAASAAPAADAALQQRVDSVLAAIPGGTQVSATEIRYDGLTVTFSRTTADAPTAMGQPPDCRYGWLCFLVRGTKFEFYTCKTWDLKNWLGLAPYSNNQTPLTTSYAYDNNWKQRWRSVAGDAGEVNVNPWYHLKVC
ncbi:MAG TPA: hypothetical protein VFH03_09940 [Actinoplanes sp.]|nr:hypothetical protein [Actinoplanes sp.]